MTSPVPLRIAAPAPVPEVVDLLRELLARAEAGDIVAIGIATVKPDGSIGTGYHAGERVWPLLGAIQHCAIRVSLANPAEP